MIASERLLLRPLDDEDASFVLALLTDPDFLRHIGDRGVHDQDSALDYIEEATLLAVIERDSGRPVGLCGLIRRDFLDAPDLGYAFLPIGRGRGYAREAAGAVLAGIEERIVAIVNSENAASIAVLDALGFGFERVMTHPEDGEVLLYERALRAVPAEAGA